MQEHGAENGDYSMNKKMGKLFTIAGLLCLMATLLLVVYNLHESRRAEQQSNEALQKIETYLEETPTSEKDSQQERELMVCEIDGVGYIGSLKIPALNRELPIIHEWNYENLKKAICRYKGSPYTNDFIVAGHNYRKHFMGIARLVPGDEIIFTDMEGKEFCYEVAELEKMSKTEVERMEAGEWDLTLFTCDYGGRNRVAVRCITMDK